MSSIADWQWYVTQNISSTELDALRLSLPRCDTAPADLLAAVDDALEKFKEARRELALEKRADRRRLQQIKSAAEKLQRLMGDAGGRAALEGGLSRAMAEMQVPEELRYPSILVSRGLDNALTLYLDDLRLAIAAPPTSDVRRDEPLNDLLANLARIYSEACGEGVSMTYDPVAAQVGGPFFAFLRIATARVLGPVPPSDEALRTRVREQVELGRIAQKKVGRRLYQPAAEAANKVVTQRNDEVTNDDETPGRRS